MYLTTLLAMMGTAVTASVVSFSDPIYEAVMSNHTLPTNYVLDQFNAMGIAPNRTVETEDGLYLDIFEFEHDTHDALEKYMIHQVMTQGPMLRSNSAQYESTEIPANSLDRRIAGDQDSFACKTANSIVYSYTLATATSAACQAIFQGSVKIGTTYVQSRTVNDIMGRRATVTLKYAWFVASFGLNNACTTLTNNIVTKSCASSVSGNKGKSSGSSGGSVQEIASSGRTDATADVTIVTQN